MESAALLRCCAVFPLNTHYSSPLTLSPLVPEHLRRAEPDVCPATVPLSEENQITYSTSGYGTGFSVSVISARIIMENTNYQK